MSIIFTLFYQFEPKHIVAHGQYVLFFINFVSVQKAVIFKIIHQFESKYDVAHLQYMLYPSAD